MLDEDSLRRLTEMGIDMYVPRSAARVESPVEAVAPAASAPLPMRSVEAGMPRVMLLADTKAAAANALTAQVARALKFARIECTLAHLPDERALEAAAGLVVFGESLARQAGALLSASRQQTMGWVAAADAAIVVRDAHAKRALWSELRRMVRALNGVKR